jgi:hypothetical protein
MCIACSQGIPACALSGPCTLTVQQAAATGLIFGSAFLGVAKDWLYLKLYPIIKYLQKIIKE